jgi:hypothetical protein
VTPYTPYLTALSRQGCAATAFITCRSAAPHATGRLPPSSLGAAAQRCRLPHLTHTALPFVSLRAAAPLLLRQKAAALDTHTRRRSLARGQQAHARLLEYEPALLVLLGLLEGVLVAPPHERLALHAVQVRHRVHACSSDGGGGNTSDGSSGERAATEAASAVNALVAVIRRHPRARGVHAKRGVAPEQSSNCCSSARKERLTRHEIKMLKLRSTEFFERDTECCWQADS